MRELRQHAEPVLRIICLLLAGLVLYQLAGIAIRWNPFRSVNVPPLPILTVSTNTPADAGQGPRPMATASVKGTNGPARPAGTNSAPARTANTNSVSTNAVFIATDSSSTNAALIKAPLNVTTNSVTLTELPTASTPASTNTLVKLEDSLSGTNVTSRTNALEQTTNTLAVGNGTGTNVSPVLKPVTKTTNSTPAPTIVGMNPGPFSGPGISPGKRGGDLPPAIQMRIDRITESEILGPVIRPMPMGLLGIAGDCAFLRSGTGQTGLVKEGDSLGDLKLIRIGINRVLVEQAGQKKELMIFSGYGGDSLLPNDNSNENKHP